MQVRVSGRPVRIALAAALVLLLAAALAGAFAPAASAAPDAAQLDAFLSGHDSPMAGTGAVFIAEGQLYGVDPVFLVAIAGAESSFGKQLYSKDGDECTYNAFNWFYGPTWPTSDFSSWDQAIARVAEGLGGCCTMAPASSRWTPSRRGTARTAPPSGSPTSRRS